MGNTGETLIVSKDVVALNELRWYEHAPLRLRIEAKPALRASQGETGITETEDYRGEKVLAAYTHIPKTKWGFVAKQDLREVYAPIRSLLWNVLILLLISAMVVYGLAILLARNIARPVFEMAEVSKKIQEGDFSARNRVQSADELGYLAETFNTMADSISSQMDLIKKAEDQLRRERDSLEEQVQERTLDLQQELDERKRAEEALRESEERFRSFIDSATDGFTLLDSELNYIEINKSGLEIIGLDRKYFMGKNIVDVVPDIKKTGRYDKYKKVIKTSVPLLVSDLIPNPKFGNKHIELKAFKVGDGLGIIFTDITERERAKEQIKASLREKEVLLREIHHRVKNNMQVIISLLRLQSDYTKEKQYSEMLEDSQSRIKSMALIHEKLYQSEDLTNIDFNGYVKDLGNRLFGSHGVSPEKIALNIEIEDVSLGLENAIPCGLIINELVSNSLKHAFPQEREGEIRITLRSINGDEIELTVSDNGVGIPEDLDLRNTESLGLHLVTILSEDQLDGKIELNRTGGTKFHIQFKREIYRGRV
jgi:two-component sensor histidine kinase/HAMP domain-containing protein